MVDDSSSGSELNQFNHTGSDWYHSSIIRQGFYQHTLSYDNATNDAVTLAFTGVGDKIYGAKDSLQGIAATR